MIGSFRDKGSEDIYDDVDTPAGRRALPRMLWPKAQRKLDQINRIVDVRELAVPPGNQLERLRGNRSEQLSIRINEQYRICFYWENGNAYEVEITDYH